MNRQPTGVALAAPTLVETLQVWLCRIVAIYCLLFGVLYWVRLVGIHDGLSWRFDTMPAYWQAVSSSLAVFFPFAAVGLWMLASWGAVVWAICAVTEVVMYAGFPELFGHRTMILWAHLLVALIYIALRVVIYLQTQPKT